MMNKLKTKADTLKSLYGKLNYATILPQLIFTLQEWKNNRQGVLVKYKLLEWNHRVIVRSSALNEDTNEFSSAGKFESVLNVSGNEEFINAVEKVIGSYDDSNPYNQILVQPMLEDIHICGVAFTIEPSTMGNYYVINYDCSGVTDVITAGTKGKQKLYYHFKKAGTDKAPEELRKIILFLQELESFFEQDNLDVEFAVTSKGEIFCLQVRALCVNSKRILPEEQENALKRIADKIKREFSSKPYLCGKTVIYGVMPDWNPAEMIGIRPKPMALSLYREIITDNIWAYQRDNYGYRNLRSFPLMVEFCGLPYIDVRVSFNSFIPAELEEGISEKLVNYYLDRLAEDPSKHDKVEFEIVFSCYTLDLPERIQTLKQYGFTDKEIGEIVNSLRNITNRIIDHGTGLWRKDLKKISILEKRQEEILNSDMGKIEKIYWLLEDCKRYGTLPFAGLARAAFIAVQILKSLVNTGIFSEKDYERFMSEVSTVSSKMNKDFGELSKPSFLKKYGHLRPGTYDITSPRYDEAPDLYFNWTEAEKSGTGQVGKFSLTLEQMQLLRENLSRNGLNNDILELMDFIKHVIEGREYGKFIFTKSLSKVLQMIGEIGEENGLSQMDCSYINIQVIRELYVSTRDIKASLMRSICIGKEEYEVTKSIVLPPVVLGVDDVWAFYYPDTEPNYVTLECTRGKVAIVNGSSDKQDLKDKILLIQSADPGYDWIFTQGLRGFITKYGGANSHMAIRAGELGIPAVIGVGEKCFEEYKEAVILEINAAEKKIKVLSKKSDGY